MKTLFLNLAIVVTLLGQNRINGNRTIEGSVNTCADAGSTAVTDFQILASSGNIASGIARCYGVAK